MNRITITGATGFLGRHICKLLAIEGHQINVICRNISKAELYFKNYPTITYTQTSDIFAENDIFYSELFKDCDVLIHSAWEMTSGFEENLRCLQGTIRIANIISKLSGKRFIGIGTCAEYDIDNFICKTNSNVLPSTMYGASKASAYFWVKNLFLNSLSTYKWCRVFYLYGEDENENRLYSYIRQSLEHNKPVFLTDGNQIRDYLEVSKAAEMIISEINKDDNGIRNICSGIPITIRQFAENIAEAYEKKDLLYFGTRERNQFDPDCIVGIPYSDFNLRNSILIYVKYSVIYFQPKFVKDSNKP